MGKAAHPRGRLVRAGRRPLRGARRAIAVRGRGCVAHPLREGEAAARAERRRGARRDRCGPHPSRSRAAAHARGDPRGDPHRADPGLAGARRRRLHPALARAAQPSSAALRRTRRRDERARSGPRRGGSWKTRRRRRAGRLGHGQDRARRSLRRVGGRPRRRSRAPRSLSSAGVGLVQRLRRDHRRSQRMAPQPHRLCARRRCCRPTSPRCTRSFRSSAAFPRSPARRTPRERSRTRCASALSGRCASSSRRSASSTRWW